MLRNIRISLFIEVGLLIPTMLAVLGRGIASSYSERLTTWFLTFLIGTIVYCIYLFQNNVKAEIVKAICSIAISIILAFNLTSDQGTLDVLALLVQSFFSAAILHNLIKNYSSYK